MRALLALLVVCAVLTGCNRRIDPATTEAEARALLAQGRDGEARILLKNALARNPSFTIARVLLADIAMGEGNPKAARDELSVADANALLTPEAIALRTHVALALGDVDEADRLMREYGPAIAEPGRTILQAGVQLAGGAAPEALALLRERQRGSPADPRLALEIASTLTAMGNLTPAIEELDRYLARQPVDRSDALKARGELHLRQGAPERAAEDFAAAIKAAPDSWPRISRLTTELMVGDSLLASGDIAAAKEQIRRIERTWPGMQGTELLQAQVALLEGRSGEAAGRMASIAEANPDNVRLQYLLIDALVKSGNITRATELLERRVAAEPETAAARNALADLYMQQGRPDRVIDLLGEIVDEDILDSDESGELLASARVAREQARADITTLTAKLRETPGDIKLLAELASAQTANGDPASALITLGAMPLRGWIPESAAARMAALIAMDNEFESNRLVDRLLDPSSGTEAAVLVAAADVAYRARQNANVSRLLDRAAQLDPGNADVQLRRASLAFDERKFVEAEDMLRPLASGSPPNLAAQVALARVVEARGDLAQARAILGSAIGGNPDDPEPSLRLAALELRANQPAAASEVLNRMVTAAKDGEAANAAGMLLADENRFDEARTRFRQAVDREPENARYWFNLGQAQLVLTDPAAASESFTRAASLEPGSLPVALAAVRTALGQHNVSSARRSVDALLTEAPDDPVSQLLLGDVAMSEGKAQQAEVAYSRSFGLRPGSLAAIGEYHARVRLDSPRAVEPLLRWLAREPEDSEARHLLADYHLGHGQDEDARVQLELLIRQTPNDVVALNNLAWLLRETDKARAEQLAVQAQAIAPENPAVADTLGTILLANGKVAEALVALKKAAIALPDDKSVQGHYAEALRRVEGLR
jgi:cellulose synthase operon protein C